MHVVQNWVMAHHWQHSHANRTFGSVLVNFEPHDAKVNVKNAPFPRYNGKYNKKNQKLSTNPNQKYFLALLQTFGTHQKGLRSNIYCLKKAKSKIAE